MELDDGGLRPKPQGTWCVWKIPFGIGLPLMVILAIILGIFLGAPGVLLGACIGFWVAAFICLILTLVRAVLGGLCRRGGCCSLVLVRNIVLVLLVGFGLAGGTAFVFYPREACISSGFRGGTINLDASPLVLTIALNGEVVVDNKFRVGINLPDAYADVSYKGNFLAKGDLPAVQVKPSDITNIDLALEFNSDPEKVEGVTAFTTYCGTPTDLTCIPTIADPLMCFPETADVTVQIHLTLRLLSFSYVIRPPPVDLAVLCVPMQLAAAEPQNFTLDDSNSEPTCVP